MIDTNFGKIRNGNWLKINLCILFSVRSVLEAAKEKPKPVTKKSV